MTLSLESLLRHTVVSRSWYSFFYLFLKNVRDRADKVLLPLAAFGSVFECKALRTSQAALRNDSSKRSAEAQHGGYDSLRRCENELSIDLRSFIVPVIYTTANQFRSECTHQATQGSTRQNRICQRKVERNMAGCTSLTRALIAALIYTNIVFA